MLYIKRYNETDKDSWNQFVSESKNGTFLFNRNYIDYHNDRFVDFSVIIYSDNNIIALFPASISSPNRVVSHGGLTYGGVISDINMTTELMIEVFNLLLSFYSDHDIKEIVYKRVPSIYYDYPSDEDLYVLYRLNASLIRRDISSTISLGNKIPFSSRRIRAIKKAKKNNLIVQESKNYSEYMSLLNSVLQLHHGVRAVHSTQEIEKLANSFPHNIKLYVSLDDKNKIVAGVVVYINKGTVHAQYIANSEDGRKIGALDYLFDFLINDEFADKRWFDFGICTENNGNYLNVGLITQKQEFGGRGVVYDFYLINTDVRVC